MGDESLLDSQESPYIEVTGMVIEQRPIGEYDRRVVLLTRERGKISAFAKSARKPTASLHGTTDLFAFGTFRLFAGKSSYTLTEANILNYFESLQRGRTTTRHCFCSLPTSPCGPWSQRPSRTALCAPSLRSSSSASRASSRAFQTGQSTVPPACGRWTPSPHRRLQSSTRSLWTMRQSGNWKRSLLWP